MRPRLKQEYCEVIGTLPFLLQNVGTCPFDQGGRNNLGEVILGDARLVLDDDMTDP